MVCRGNRISLYTLNGALLLDQDVCESIDDRVMSCVFYEGVNNEWQERELIFTGHRKGVVNVRSPNSFFHSRLFSPFGLKANVQPQDMEQDHSGRTFRVGADSATPSH